MSESHSPIFRLRRRDIAFVAAVAVGQALALVAFLLLIIRVATQMQQGPPVAGDPTSWSPVLGLGLGLVVAALAHAGLRGLEFAYAEKVGYEVVRQLRIRMYDRMQALEPLDLQRRSRGGLLLRFTGDLTMLRTWISRGMLGGMASAITLTLAMIVLFVIDPWIAMGLLTVLLFGTALSVSRGPVVRRATRVTRRRRSLLTSNIDEQLQAFATVRVSGRSGGEGSRLARQNDSLTRSLDRVADQRGVLRAIATGTGLLAVVAVVMVGFVQVYQGATSIPVVIATVAISSHLSAPVRILGLSHDYWQRSRVSAAKIGDFLAGEDARRAADEDLPAFRARRGSLEIRDLTLGQALRGVSASARGGQVIAITGRSGAGKSTLLQAVARIVEADSGQILVDDQDLADVRRSTLHRRLGMVSAELPLMRGTVRRNLLYRCPDADDQELTRVILDTGLDEVLNQLDGGLGAWVVESGANLSLGQRQRIALGRALMGNPVLLLLDEPTNGLDAPAKEAVRRALAHHQGTILLVTHDPAEIAMADVVWVMDEGQVVYVMDGHEARRRRGLLPVEAGPR